MSDSEPAPATKPKRTMSPEARARMLENLKRGREARAKKLADSKAPDKSLSKTSVPKEVKDAQDGVKDAQTLGNDAQSEPENAPVFNCECGKTYKHVQSFKRHQKSCAKVINDTKDESNTEATKDKVASESEPDEEPVKAKKKKKKRMVLVESSSESEEEVLVKRVRKKDKPKVSSQPKVSYQPQPPAAPPPRRQLTRVEYEQIQHQKKIQLLAMGMANGGLR